MDNQTVGVDLDEESREQKVCIHPLATRPVLYTDTVGGNYMITATKDGHTYDTTLDNEGGATSKSGLQY